MSHRFSFYSKQQSQELLERLKVRRSLNFTYLIIDRDKPNGQGECPDRRLATTGDAPASRASQRDLDEWITKIEAESCFIALDTETKGLTPAPGMVKTLQIAYCQDKPVLIIKLPEIKDRTSLQRLMASSKLVKVGHSFSRNWMRRV